MVLQTTEVLAGFNAQQLRAVATGTGDLHVAAMAEVRRMLAENKGSALRTAKAGLERLVADKLISPDEATKLGTICDKVASAERPQGDPVKAFAEVRAIYHGMLLNPASSAVALAIGSLAASGGRVDGAAGPNLPSGAIAAVSRSDKVDTGIVGGAILGGVIGGVIGGPAGAIVGGVIGGIAAGGATLCAT